MTSLILTALLIYIGWSVYKKITSMQISIKQNKPKISSGEMIACKACGTYVLKDEAIQKQHYYYCSKSCSQHK